MQSLEEKKKYSFLCYNKQGNISEIALKVQIEIIIYSCNGNKNLHHLKDLMIVIQGHHYITGLILKLN